MYIYLMNAITSVVPAVFAGSPLYFFARDTVADDTNGQGLDEFGGLWYLVNPAGEAVLQ